MNVFKPLLLILLVSVLMLAIPALAQQPISGAQSGTLGPGSYLVTGPIQVPVNQTLTIMPGTDLLHAGNYVWNIYGKLIAEGTVTDSIRFIRQNPIATHRWGGIRFQTSATYSTFKYCTIDNCQSNGIYSNKVNIGVAHTRISNCTSSTDGAGIYAYSTTLTVENCVIVNNTASNYKDGGGILLNSCTEVMIRHSIIAYNKSTGT